MSKELDAIYATAAKVSALGAQRELADAIEQSLPHLLANEPHPWPIGLIKLYVLSKPDEHTLGWLEMHNGRRFPVLRPIDAGWRAQPIVPTKTINHNNHDCYYYECGAAERRRDLSLPGADT